MSVTPVTTGYTGPEESRQHWEPALTQREAAERFEPRGSAETAAHAWVTRGEVAALALHPGFAATWVHCGGELEC